ncbi:hypothetical protein Save01_07217 [Streptomyces avermitilis]|uniref:Uncharacterized protein n=1 Tax=Streptomyces avermitilis TaxID=33903 RepID=A0A4D4MFX8_STRAX|nr:hypothetical protein SAV14893_081510 [Streptomyces avermitilis]GDY70860.1 hypothetical protein SAV31267_003450 [Streptomyces avermitilis]
MLDEVLAVTAVDPYLANAGVLCGDLAQQRGAGDGVLHARGGDQYGKEEPERVGDDALAPWSRGRGRTAAVSAGAMPVTRGVNSPWSSARSSLPQSEVGSSPVLVEGKAPAVSIALSGWGAAHDHGPVTVQNLTVPSSLLAVIRVWSSVLNAALST